MVILFMKEDRHLVKRRCDLVYQHLVNQTRLFNPVFSASLFIIF